MEMKEHNHGEILFFTNPKSSCAHFFHKDASGMDI